jgi:S-adenosylhomocysteine hydrolase
MATTPTQLNCDVKSLDFADFGKKRIDWANQSMKVLQIIRKEFIKNQPLKGIRISACLHVTAETANLAICLRDGGADVVLCASNPLSTQDDVAASLMRDHNIPVFAIKGEDNDTYYGHILAAIDHKPQITMMTARPRTPAAHEASGRARRRNWWHRGNHDGRNPSARDGQTGRALPIVAVNDATSICRQPLWYWPIDD